MSFAADFFAVATLHHYRGDIISSLSVESLLNLSSQKTRLIQRQYIQRIGETDKEFT
jgi:hypothetical protein